jgi:hypothetical protein
VLERVRRRLVAENTIAALILSAMVFLGWPAITQSNVANDLAHCGCPALNGGCETPCLNCCDDRATPDVEKCPCEESPTHGR